MTVAALAAVVLAAADAGSQITAYGPIIVAVGGLVTAVVAAFSRRDRKIDAASSNLDAKTNTAIKGLTEAYDRLETERSRWEQRALAAEARVRELEDEEERSDPTTPRPLDRS